MENKNLNRVAMVFDFSFWGNLASVISFFLTLGIFISLFFIRSRFLIYGIEESQVKALVTHYNHLSSTKKFSAIATSTRVDLRAILTHVKKHYEKKWLSKKLYKQVLSDIDDLISILDEDENCTRNSTRLHIRTIILKIEN